MNLVPSIKMTSNHIPYHLRESARSWRRMKMSRWLVQRPPSFSPKPVRSLLQNWLWELGAWQKGIKDELCRRQISQRPCKRVTCLTFSSMLCLEDLFHNERVNGYTAAIWPCTTANYLLEKEKTQIFFIIFFQNKFGSKLAMRYLTTTTTTTIGLSRIHCVLQSHWYFVPWAI